MYQSALKLYSFQWPVGVTSLTANAGKHSSLLGKSPFSLWWRQRNHVLMNTAWCLFCKLWSLLELMQGVVFGRVSLQPLFWKFFLMLCKNKWTKTECTTLLYSQYSIQNIWNVLIETVYYFMKNINSLWFKGSFISQTQFRRLEK